MQSQRFEVIPYAYGAKLFTTVLMDRKEVFEGEIPLALLFQHFAEAINPYDLKDEMEAYDLIETLEAAIRAINEVLGDEDE